MSSNANRGLVTCLVVTTAINAAVGFGCCVAGGVRWDRRTRLAFKHAGGADVANAVTAYDSDISLAFVLAAINLLTTVWPAACLGDKWVRTRARGAESVWERYRENVTKYGVNPYRWFEFALSVPLAVLVCTIGLGANDLLFMLSQMTLTVALVVVTYGQEREKMLGRVLKTKTLLWFPLSTAVGLFACQWALIFWTAYEARGFARDTKHWGWAPTVSFFAGNAAIMFVVARTTEYLTPVFKRSVMAPVTAEIVAQIASCATRVSLTISALPLFQYL